MEEMALANRLSLRGWIDYRVGAAAASELAREAVAGDAIAFVDHFPADRRALAEFGTTFGEVMRKYSNAGDALEDRIGLIRYRRDIAPEERLDTQGSSELRPHTANAWAARRPRVFGLLMVDQGWVDEPAGARGESFFVAVRDAVDHLAVRFPDTFEEDLRLLTGTPVEFFGNALSRRNRTRVSRLPLLFTVDGDERLGIRYRESMLAALREVVDTVPGGSRWFEAAERLDLAMETAPRVELALRPSQLVVLDNRLVLHARRPFVAERPDGAGGTAANPRLLYSVHAGPHGSE
jgi:alpha-ketoglutarate-dependent taurine dioxygenase